MLFLSVFEKAGVEDVLTDPPDVVFKLRELILEATWVAVVIVRVSDGSKKSCVSEYFG